MTNFKEYIFCAMRVFFDFEIQDEFERRKLNPLVNDLLEEIRKDVISRLNVFSDTMSIQEEAFNSFVVITMITENPPMVRFKDYAPSLIKKMNNCFPPEFYTYLNMKLSLILSSWVN